jgi:hypothetical protein
MLSSMIRTLDSIYIISRRILNKSHHGKDGVVGLKTITRSVFFKYEELYNKFVKSIELAKKVIDSDISRNKSI